MALFRNVHLLMRVLAILFTILAIVSASCCVVKYWPNDRGGIALSLLSLLVCLSVLWKLLFGRRDDKND